MLHQTVRASVDAALLSANELFDDCSVTLRGQPRGELRHAKTFPEGKKKIASWVKSSDLAVSMLKLMEQV